MRIFLTGGSGLVGRHVIAALRARGDTILGLSRSSAADALLVELGAEPFRGDLGDETALHRGVEICDAVVHAAAIILDHGDWATYHAANVAPTEFVASACAQTGRRLVHLSSVAVYGRTATYDGGRGSVTEDFGTDRPLFPGDHYARSKRAAEAAVLRLVAERGLSAVALRPCVLYGEGDRNFSARAVRFLRLGIAPLIGNGDNALSLIYAGNVASAVVAALDRPHVTGAFNVANDGGVTQRQFVEWFADGFGAAVRLVRVPRGLAWRSAVLLDATARRLQPWRSVTLLKSAVQFLANDNPYVSTRAQQELGWSPDVGPEDAVRRTGRWYRERAGAAGG